MFGMGDMFSHCSLSTRIGVKPLSKLISGSSDWGTYQSTGAFERMKERACTDMREVRLVKGAGHWVQQEQAEVVSRLILDFLA